MGKSSITEAIGFYRDRLGFALMGAARWDVALLDELSQAMTDASICGLGQAAPNPIRCVMKYFPDEIK